jgi:hypothetical protein
MNKAELVAQRLGDLAEKYGPIAAATAKRLGSAHKLPATLLHSQVTTPRKGEQVAQYLADYGNYPAGMSICMAAGLNGDAADGCPFAGTEYCTCDVDGER